MNCSLTLRFPEVYSNQFDSLTELFRANTRLTSLWIWTSDANQPQKLLELTNAIAANHTLLDLEFCCHFDQIPDGFAQTVATMLAAQRRLTRIDLHGYRQSDLFESADEQRIVADGLVKNYQLLDVTVAPFTDVDRDGDGGVLRFASSFVAQRNASLQPQVVTATIIDVCLGLGGALPNYVLLEVIDWLPSYEAGVDHTLKIRLIESIHRSMRRVRQLRRRRAVLAAFLDAVDRRDGQRKSTFVSPM